MPSHAGLDAILRNSAPSPSRAAPVTPASPSAEVAREILGVHAREGGDESNFATAWWYAHPRAWQSAGASPAAAADSLRAAASHECESPHELARAAAFAELAMADSNQFHSTCLDTFPPIFYMNDVSRAVIQVVHAFNSACGETRDVW